ncbi:uncharacterized protein METZ01_LOCUS84220 [marine metagenome]|uniref:Uncharacterized protein n=1 Tax=marine metagenome TaxID=408172 RepID=A0A381UTA8_9ZZZZ
MARQKYFRVILRGYPGLLQQPCRHGFPAFQLHWVVDKDQREFFSRRRPVG